MIRSPSNSQGGRTVTAAVLLIALVALAGCNAFQDDAENGPPVPNGSAAEERYASVTGVNGTLNVTQHHDGNVSWSVQRIATRPGTGDFRNEVIATGPAGPSKRSLGVGSLVVSNGSVRYVYAAESDTTFRSQVDADERRDRPAEIRRLFAELRDAGNGTIRRPTPGVSPLPVVPAGNGSRNDSAAVQWREDNVTVDYRGNATVAGRSTYVIDLQPASSDAALVEATLWLDTEFLYPLKRHTVAYHRGERYEYTAVYRNVTFNPTFQREPFEVDPDTLPGNGSTAESRSFDSRGAMVEALDRPVPDPDVPNRFVFAGGFYSGGEIESLSLSYATPDERERIRVSAFSRPANLSDGRRVTIGGTPAAFERFRDNRYLQFNVDGRQVSVTGTVDNRTLRRVAASLLDE